jgi:ubiquitin carboxyl-terminal hydrolase 36/42
MKGLNNLGNTCYMNSALQMLFANIDLCKLIIRYQNRSDELSKISDFIKFYHDPSRDTINPAIIKSIVANKKDTFLGYRQQDAEEFLTYFLELLNSNIKDNYVDKLYNIKIKQTVKCKVMKCLNKSESIFDHTKLVLDVEDNDSLDECYRKFKMSDRLEGDEMYYCEKCQKKRIASKRYEVEEWPKHLIVMLRRFTHKNGRLDKNTKSIDIPFEWRKGYKLVGGIHHSGSLNGGHYVYFGKYNDNWYLFNDCSVTQLHSSSLDNFKNNSYIYYYIRD